MKQYDKAIEYLENFDSEDEMLGPVALGAVGDAFADIDQGQQALEYYEKAAAKKKNGFTAPLYLYKAGMTAMGLEKFGKAATLFTKIKENYPTSEQAKDVEKFINAATYAKK